ncbi:hypothetical protein PVA17_07435 [Lysinibacillus sp. CNPSo 3705]|uniref:hypothetical protein n=1 Tax=Lysinibacillus sp. CNPSo 3705 TaxID=3028148 RepID=UPI002363AF05|nr:hypothetical protein [Lysinibacillus sp. CNPSo 3705]MDD1502599.1 hypothetical protein [Lysinibacillus sp. CNPSo 3705]
MQNEKIGERLASVEVEIKNQENRISKLEGNHELLYRLTLVSEQQQEMNKHQQIQLNRMDKTFNNINMNLTKLNMTQDELQEDVKGIGKRVDSIEDDLKLESAKDSILISDMIKQYLHWWILIPTIIIGGLILKSLGL